MKTSTQSALTPPLLRFRVSTFQVVQRAERGVVRREKTPGRCCDVLPASITCPLRELSSVLKLLSDAHRLLSGDNLPPSFSHLSTAFISSLVAISLVIVLLPDSSLLSFNIHSYQGKGNSGGSKPCYHVWIARVFTFCVGRRTRILPVRTKSRGNTGSPRVLSRSRHHNASGIKVASQILEHERNQ